MSTNFTLVKRGYNPVEVDNYIKILEQQLDEYREKTAAINNAIINAQLAADNIIKEAHLKTEKMLSGAEKDSLRLKQRTLSQLVSLKKNVEGQKSLVESFQNEYNELLKKYLEPIETNEVNPILSKLSDIEKLIDELSNPDIEAAKKDSDKITLDANENKLGSENGSVSNPYAKHKEVPISNPYAKINSAPSNPYAKHNEMPVSNPYAKINTSPSNPYAKADNAENQMPGENLKTVATEKNISPFENNHKSPFENSSFPIGGASHNPSKPGIYKASDLYNNFSSDEEVYPSGLSKEEIEELMPPKR